MHLRVLRQIAQARRRRLQDARNERAGDGRDGRLRDADDSRSRADAQLAAASARRRLPRKAP